ncbi:MAG: quinol:electron acceptor oxidoreductase subunit ActD [Chromatiaceae bacterium]
MADRLLVVAALPSADALAAAFDAAWRAGHQHLEALSSHPLPALQARGVRPRYGLALAVAVLVAGLAFLIQYYAAVWAYPMDVSGKPVDAWAPLTPAAAVLGLMAGAVVALVVMLRDAGLPRLYHPVFDAGRFDLAEDECYVLALTAREAELYQLRPWLEALGAERIEEVRL